MDFSGKVAIVTGASAGIGTACARLLSSKGAQVVWAGRSAAKLQKVQGSGDLTVAGDLTIPEDREALIERCLERYGRLDLLIQSAGVGMYGPLTKADPGDVRRLFEINLFAPIELARLAVPHVAESGGAIVMVGSIAGQVVLPWMTAYSASKSALHAIAAGLRMELADSGIHVMAVAPGYVKTSFQEHVLAGQVPEPVRRQRRFAITPEQCAGAIIRGLEKRQRFVATPWGATLLVKAWDLFPGLVERRLAAMLPKP